MFIKCPWVLTQETTVCTCTIDLPEQASAVTCSDNFPVRRLIRFGGCGLELHNWKDLNVFLTELSLQI